MPKKLSPILATLKMRIARYCERNVKLIAEVPSKTAKTCNHPLEDHLNDDRVFHSCRPRTEGKLHISEMQRLFLKLETQVKS